MQFKRSVIVAMAFAAMVFAAPASTAIEVLDSRSGLKSLCQPISVVADIPRGDQIGLDVFEMNDIAKSRFLAAKLLESPSSGTQSLIVETTILGTAYFITMKLRRVVDLGNNYYGFAIVWEDEASGFHGESPHHVMDVLSDQYDIFINAYLSVNRGACGAKS